LLATLSTAGSADQTGIKEAGGVAAQTEEIG